MRSNVAYKYARTVRLLRHYGALTGKELLHSPGVTVSDDVENGNGGKMATEADEE
jgi:hypothetical protein